MSVGKFITIEGAEGVGKSTQCALLSNALEADFGCQPLLTREPGGTLFGESIRAILLDPKLPAMSSAAELLLMFAARAEHLSGVIRPALARGDWVICDRFTDASYAYQGGGRDLGFEQIRTLEDFVQDGFTPDLTLLLDLDLDTAFKRVAKRGQPDRIEQEGRAFFQRVRDAYLQRAADCPQRIVVVDAGPTVDLIHASIMQIAREKLM